ncbi:hypothetical protein D3C80_1837650 [compost metagenome]
MQDQDFAAIQVQHLFFRQQLHAAGTGKALAHQKITVAVDKVAGHARLLQRFQRRGDFSMQRFGFVIADPGFEQIAEYVQGFGVYGILPQKTQKTGSNCRFLCA